MLGRLLRSPVSRCVVLAVILPVLTGLLQAQQTPPFVYAYDEAGRLIGMADATGNTTTYTYDALGNILSITRGNAAVSILAFTPKAGPVSTSVTIMGAGFSATAAQNSVTFNGVPATVVTATPNRLVAVVPAGATTGPIRVTSPAGTALSTTPFTVGLNGAPAISGFTPIVGIAGSAVTITGVNFEPSPGGNKVAFNGHLSTISSATATTLQTVVPPSATSGRITVATPNGRATSTGDFFVPPSPAADVEATGRMAIGETRALTITQAGKIGLMVFDGTAGQRISLKIALSGGLSGGNCESVSIRRPDGDYLVSLAYVCGSVDFIDRQILPVSGTYLITIDPSENETGTATLTLYDVPPDTTATIVPGGSQVTVATTTPGQNAQVAFSGVAGQRISLNVGFGSGLYPYTGWCNYVSIQNPDGTPLLSQTTQCGPSYFSDMLVLPATGVYVITVNPGGPNVGSATLTLYSVPPDTTGTITPGGSSVAVTTTVPSQNAQVSFSGAAGQRASLLVNFGSGLYPGSACNYVSIQNPDGTPLLGQTTQCGPSYFSDVFVLPATGTYVIKVNPGGLNIGSATLTLYNVPPDITASIVAGGPPVTVTTTTPGQNAQVGFVGGTSASAASTVNEIFSDGFESGDISAWGWQAAGRRVSLLVNFGSGLYPGSSCNYISIQNPNGTPLLSETTQCGPSYFSDLVTLAATGAHTIIVNPGGVNVGVATLTLYEVPEDATGSITVGGPAAGLTVAVPAQNAAVTFNGTAAQSVTVRLTNNTIGQVTVTLRKPDGSTQVSFSTSATSFNLATQTLPATGTYNIFVNPNGNRTGSINVAATSP